MARTVHFPQTDLGTQSFVANGHVQSFDYVPQSGKTCALHLIASEDGTGQVFEIHKDGSAHALGDPVAFSANDVEGAEDEVHFVDRPARQLRVVYTNTSGVAGTVTFSVVAGS